MFELVSPSDIKGSNAVLIMTSSSRSSTLIGEFLSEMDVEAPKGHRGRRMMERKLRQYLLWRGNFEQQRSGKDQSCSVAQSNCGTSRVAGSGSVKASTSLSESLKRKDKARQERGANRRRVRGGGPSSRTNKQQQESKQATTTLDDDEEITTMWDFIQPYVQQPI